MNVSIAYASPEKQKTIVLDVPRGTTAIEAIKLAKILTDFPELAINNLQIGIYNQKVSPDTALQENDRVEIYRPLLIDPKEKRRLKAKK